MKWVITGFLFHYWGWMAVNRALQVIWSPNNDNDTQRAEKLSPWLSSVKSFFLANLESWWGMGLLQRIERLLPSIILFRQLSKKRQTYRRSNTFVCKKSESSGVCLTRDVWSQMISLCAAKSRFYPAPPHCPRKPISASLHPGNYSNKPSLPSHLFYSATWRINNKVHVILCRCRSTPPFRCCIFEHQIIFFENV